jgi:hypothetical protein
MAALLPALLAFAVADFNDRRALRQLRADKLDLQSDLSEKRLRR